MSMSSNSVGAMPAASAFARLAHAVCQYDANAFDGATLMKILKVHPMMVIRGAVVRNPCYIQPDEFLARSS